jgi:hypothetical protein
MGIYGGVYDIGNEGNLSYHSSDGSDKDDSVGNLSLGNGAEGTSPLANARNTAGQSLLGKQHDDLLGWLQEKIDNQAYNYLTCFLPLSPNASHALHARTASM